MSETSTLPRVLVVDDDATILEIISRYLRAKGFEVVSAESPLGVSAFARRHCPAVIIST